MIGDDWNECRALLLHFQSSRPHYRFCTAYLEPTLEMMNATIVLLGRSIFHLDTGLQAALESA
jgi:hypothetical protein